MLVGKLRPFVFNQFQPFLFGIKLTPCRLKPSLCRILLRLCLKFRKLQPFLGGIPCNRVFVVA